MNAAFLDRNMKEGKERREADWRSVCAQFGKQQPCSEDFHRYGNV